MRGTKAKALRSECKDFAKMEHVGIEIERKELVSTTLNKQSGKMLRHFSTVKTNLPVNHYRNAKRFLVNGNISQAVAKASDFASFMELRKVYKFI